MKDSRLDFQPVEVTLILIGETDIIAESCDFHCGSDNEGEAT